MEMGSLILNILKSVFFVLLFSVSVQAACLQSFNGYGPVYAPSVLHRTDMFMREILQEECEVVHLQEIWNKKQIARVEQWVDLSFISFAPNTISRNGLMSLSRWNVFRTEYQKFRYNTDGGLLDGGRDLAGVEKGFAVQWLKTPGGDMAFVNLHLHPSSQAVRLAQIFQLIQWRIRHGNAPVVVTGDFNMTPQSLEKALIVHGLRVQDVMDLYRGGYPSQFCTYCSGNRLGWLSEDRVFDYIFISNQAPLLITDVEVNLKGSIDQPLSDHYGLKLSWKFGKRDLVPRNLKLEAQQAAKVFKAVLPQVAKEYSKSSDVYRWLALWNQQLTRKQGEFWAFFSDSDVMHPQQWAYEESP